MATLAAVIICLTGGVSAIVGTVLWVALILVRRLQGVPATVKRHDLRRVWGISAFIGIPLLLPWMPDVILESGEVLLPYLYMLAIVLLAASASILIGTGLCLSTVGLARRAGLLTSGALDPMHGGWQLRLIWVVSVIVGVPLLAGRTSALIQSFVP